MSENNSEFQIDFAGIGAAKSGTTWIAKCLREHPGICMALLKETNYFTESHFMKDMPVQGRYFGRSHRDEGIEWYQSRFAHREPGQITGEFSTSYLGDPASPRLLFEHNPKLKLIVCYRNPVEAIQSAYHQVNLVQPIHDSLDVLVDKYADLAGYFRYHQNTQRFLEFFPRDQLLPLLFDDIRSDPEQTFVQLCRFLNVDDTFRPQSLHQRVNNRRVLRSKLVRDMRCLIAAAFGSTALTRKIRSQLMKVGVGTVAVKLFRMNEKPGSYEPMSPATRQKLIEIYREENNRLGEFLGRDLSHWNEAAPAAQPVQESSAPTRAAG